MNEGHRRQIVDDGRPRPRTHDLSGQSRLAGLPRPQQSRHIELPTGTGKTDLVCLYLKRLFQAGWVERVLVLVDRDQLARQALEAIQDILSAHSSYWLRPGAARQEQ